MRYTMEFDRACKADRLRRERQKKQDIASSIKGIIRTSPLSLAEEIYAFAHKRKLELLKDA